MLAVITQNGTSLIDPASFKNTSSSFPVSSSLECFTSAWSPDSANSHLYLASSGSIKRYTPSESLLEELYSGSDIVTCLEMKGKSSTLFFAAANKVWSLDCACSPGQVISSLKPHKDTVTQLSISNDGTLLASVSVSAVLVHNLTLSSHVQLKGLPDRKPITCCLFHQHSRTRLLLGIGRDLVIYDSTRPSSPLKTIRIPGGGDIIGVAASPFSKTLVAAATSNGDVVLVDLDKDNGILKTVNVKTSLTCCAFTAEGAAIYLGTESGKLLVLDLRSLEKEPKSFTIGDGSAFIKAINVQDKSKSDLGGTASLKAKSNSTAFARSSPRRSASAIRMAPTSSVSAGPGIKSPVRVTVASKIRGGGGVTPKKKLFVPVRAPLSETKNLALDGQLADSQTPTLSRRAKCLKLQESKEKEDNFETQARPPSSISCGLSEIASTRQRRPASSCKMRQDVEHLGLGAVPESISGHLATMRVWSGPSLNSGAKDERHATRRIISESVESAPRRKPSSTLTDAAQNKVRSLKAVNGVVECKQPQQKRPNTPDNIDDHFDLSSPELPREPVTPIPLGKKATKAPLASATCTGSGVLGLTSPEVATWAKVGSQKGKGKMGEMKKTRFAQTLDRSEESEDENGAEVLLGERRDEERQRELSLQVSPRRPTAAPAWLQSPHRPSAANLNMNVAAQDFLRNIVHDVMYDFQHETKAGMMGLHLDLVRMGRGWKRELREMMEEMNGEVQELKAENRRLREENERLRRGY